MKFDRRRVWNVIVFVGLCFFAATDERRIWIFVNAFFAGTTLMTILDQYRKPGDR